MSAKYSAKINFISWVIDPSNFGHFFNLKLNYGQYLFSHFFFRKVIKINLVIPTFFIINKIEIDLRTYVFLNEKVCLHPSSEQFDTL